MNNCCWLLDDYYWKSCCSIAEGVLTKDPSWDQRYQVCPPRCGISGVCWAVGSEALLAAWPSRASIFMGLGTCEGSPKASVHPCAPDSAFTQAPGEAAAVKRQRRMRSQNVGRKWGLGTGLHAWGHGQWVRGHGFSVNESSVSLLPWK